MNLIKFLTVVLFFGVLVGCGQQQPPEQVVNTAYQWEKAYMDRDYEAKQELLYEDGTYDIKKTAQKKDSGLKSENIRYEVYFDKELDWYYVFTTYKNPGHGTKVSNDLVIREKDSDWKIDMEASEDISKEDIEGKFDQVACINCK
ncbi:hypothetical protein [Peribacillus sp. R9-11]|uniref:hypothetical protein n=1 Tax=Peribacillus sp. R9-11 TaxID=3073271 RepID=UPI00286885ED|nr:hypothetical protein [Peribacillus sp. R9-11]WMX58980.1 hypothetical protein RE409_30305 [Peribacillus sp. R9-11]